MKQTTGSYLRNVSPTFQYNWVINEDWLLWIELIPKYSLMKNTSLTSLSPDVVHDFMLPLPRDIGIRENDLDILPPWVVVESIVYVVPQAIC